MNDAYDCENPFVDVCVENRLEWITLSDRYFYSVSGNVWYKETIDYNSTCNNLSKKKII